MQHNGVVRKIDELGRIVLPIEIRRLMSISEGDSLLIDMGENEIVIRKYESRCLFCGGNHNLRELRGKAVCADCIRELNK